MSVKRFNQSTAQVVRHLQAYSLTLALAVFCILALLMFAGIFFSSREQMLSFSHADIAAQFIYWRDFGFSELKKGNLALWNPHLFSGVPFFGGFQSALLYPLNFLYLLLPLTLAVNTGIILHVILLGFFMYLWMRQRGVCALPALMGGIVIMFCGPHFLHIYAGHLPNLCSMTWVPLIFMALDKLLKKPTLGGALLGSFAFAMQILSGHPQYVYYTCLAVMIYLPAVFVFRRHYDSADSLFQPARKRILFALVSIAAVFIAGAALSAVQLLPGIEAAGESVRAGGISFSFAAMFSFPPENFLTLITPYFFGDMIRTPYWGRSYLWEMNLFISINCLILAVYGLSKSRGDARPLAASAFVLLIFALGAHTPFFRILFDYFPGFDRFRGTSKFMFFAAFFMIALSGSGLDALLKKATTDAVPAVVIMENRRRMRTWISFDRFHLYILFFALIVSCGALYLKLATDYPLPTVWSHFLRMIDATGESYVSKTLFVDETFIRQAAAFSSMQLCYTALTLIIAAGLWRLARQKPKYAAYGMFLFAVLEIFVFARMTLTAFDPKLARVPALEQFVSSIKNDERILNLWQPNSALASGAYDLWGYDTGVPRKYAELIYLTQDQDPQKASQYVRFHRYHPLLQMLRFRYLITHSEGKLQIHEFPEAMSRLHLISQWRLAPVSGQTLAEIAKPDFDPRKIVILEKHPGLSQNTCTLPGTAMIIASAAADFIVEARMDCPAMLLITDNHANGWRAAGIKDRKQYEIMRANHTLMAIPLEKGEHVLRVFYRPASFTLGALISAICAILYILIFLYWLKIARKNP